MSGRPDDAPASPAALLALGLGPSGTDRVEDMDDEDLSSFLCAMPDLELYECLGRGGMGRVYRARQLRLDRFVAVKLMSSELCEDPEFRQRFEREARALARLDHAGIVRVHDFGEVEGTFYLIMEYVEGTNLRELIRSGVESQTAVRLIAQLCDALAYAHDRGVVHRDIKPENVLITLDGTVKVADFGLAKLQKVEARTRTHRIVGTPQYMAPEQLRDPKSVDHRADVFAIGVVFYEMLTGQLPVGRFPSPSEIGACDPHLDSVVLRALESDREHRFQAASELRIALESGERDAEHRTPSTRRRWSRRASAWLIGGLGLGGLAASASTWTPVAPATEASAMLELPGPIVVGSTPSTTAGPNNRRAPGPRVANRWPAVELASVDESAAILGVDWTELQQAPGLAPLIEAMRGDPTWKRCGEVVLARTHKVILAIEPDRRFGEFLIHGDWDPSDIEPCLRVLAYQGESGGSVSIRRAAVGPYLEYTVTREGAEPATVVVGQQGKRLLVSVGATRTEAEITQRLERRGSNDVVSRIAASTDLDAPIWAIGDPFPTAWHPSIAGLSGHLDVWEAVEASVVLRFSDEAEAIRASKVVEGYVTVASTLDDELDLVAETHRDGQQLFISATMNLPEELGGSMRVHSVGPTENSLGLSFNMNRAVD